ncbi:MAG: polysaccharide deacetylase family protein [Butyrivibrio sp.]|nr:polysaccharide deacetylase family protein [Butyrivibrio sp.]
MSKLTIAMYHYTRDLTHSRYPEIKGLDLPLFREQIAFFKKEFHPVRMEEVLAAVKGEQALPERALLLTFDDGYVDNYTYALPILEEAGMQGSFFIPGKTFTEHKLLDVNKIHYILASAEPDALLADVYERMDHYRGAEYDYPSNEELFAEYGVANRFDPAETIFIKRALQTVLPEAVRSRIASDLFERYVGVPEEVLAYELYMTEDQIRTMKRHGMFIGIHGYDHYWLGRLSPEELTRDLNRALEVMDPFIDRSAWVMNYPYGNSSPEVLAQCRAHGAVLGLTTEVRMADLEADDLMLLPRLDCNDFPPKSTRYEEIR